jgi:hypothetical protein
MCCARETVERVMTVVLQECYKGVIRVPGQEPAVLVVITLYAAASICCSRDSCGIPFVDLY